MGLVDDPLSGLVGVFFKRALDSKLLTYFRLAFELTLAASISFLVTCGAGLGAGMPAARAIGAGMFLAGISMFATFQVSDNAKGLKIAVTQKAADGKLDNPITTIERK